MFEMQFRKNNKVRKNTSKGSKAAVVLSFMSLLLIFVTVENTQAQILTPEQITQYCDYKLRELLQMEPPQFAIESCVKTFNYEMNTPNHLSNNPTVPEMTQKCIEVLRYELQSEPSQIAVNMCVGTLAVELNK